MIGAGASGSEIASGFARLGSEVILLEALDRVLPTEDADISKVVERGLAARGPPFTPSRWFQRGELGLGRHVLLRDESTRWTSW